MTVLTARYRLRVTTASQTESSLLPGIRINDRADDDDDGLTAIHTVSFEEHYPLDYYLFFVLLCFNKTEVVTVAFRKRTKTDDSN